ncbi:MAG TPA: pyruvate dehydrogenase (acetyl-transferring) E1 component subunit alpha [Actinomycetes bacterium]|jgi:pyruvate dehydrogenase E1 component alpha subunit|nr:pyruvate dehydrogenase (acetyl-transferring) E1 component subunit alpha [Actinomycetes bacterium]
MNSTDGQVRLLADDGTLLEHDAYEVDLSDEELRDLYVKLVVVRRIDTEGTNLQRQGQLGIWAPCLGQEAAQVGSASALKPDDFVFPSYREHGVVYVRGVDVVSVLELFRGVSLSGWSPADKGLACYAIPIGTQTLHAVGYAIGAKWDGAEQCTIVYFGDGATSEGDTSEAFNFAAVNAAPVVFFCQNNQWAISVPLSKQMAAPVWRRSFGFGFPGVQVDGNDVLAVYAVTKAAADRARDGGGPTLIEAVTYRLGAHTTTDDPTRYRTADELDMWMAREPIGRYRAFLEQAGLWSEELDRRARGEADATAARIRSAVEEMADPPLEDLVDHVYADPPATLRRQFQRLQRFEAEFVAEEG